MLVGRSCWTWFHTKPRLEEAINLPVAYSHFILFSRDNYLFSDDELSGVTNHPSFFNQFETLQVLDKVYFVWLLSEIFKFK